MSTFCARLVPCEAGKGGVLVYVEPNVTVLVGVEPNGLGLGCSESSGMAPAPVYLFEVFLVCVVVCLERRDCTRAVLVGCEAVCTWVALRSTGVGLVAFLVADVPEMRRVCTGVLVAVLLVAAILPVLRRVGTGAVCVGFLGLLQLVRSRANRS